MMRVLVDTNILLRHADTLHVLHPVAVQSLGVLSSQDHDLFLLPQNFYEFWAVSTRTLAANGLGLDIEEAVTWAAEFRSTFKVLPDLPNLHEVWLALVEQHRVSGVNSYDTRLVAAAMTHGLTHMLTFNAKDFRRYPTIEILDPHEVTSGT